MTSIKVMLYGVIVLYIMNPAVLGLLVGFWLDSMIDNQLIVFVGVIIGMYCYYILWCKFIVKHKAITTEFMHRTGM